MIDVEGTRPGRPNRHVASRVITFLPVALCLLFVVLRVFFFNSYVALHVEDGIVETGQVLIYLAAAGLAGLAGVKTLARNNNGLAGYYLLCACALFLIAMEECGWGQRLLGRKSSDYFSIYNVQGETSLHNMVSVRGYVNELYILLGCLGAFAWKLVPQKIKNINRETFDLIVPGKHLAFYFIPVFLVYTYVAYISGALALITGKEVFNIGNLMHPNPLIFIDQEPVETLLALGLFFFLLEVCFYHLKNHSPSAAATRRLIIAVSIGLVVLVVPFHLAHGVITKTVYPYDHFDFGNRLRLHNQTEEAIDQYRQALAINPYFAHAHYNLGKALTETKQLAQAAEHYQEAIRLRPGFVDAINNLGNLRAHQSKHKEAISLYKQVIAIDDTRVKTFFNLALCYQKLGQTDKAIHNYQTALKLRPDAFIIMNNLGNLFANQGQWQQALTHFVSAMQLEPNEIKPYFNAGFALKRMGQPNAAVPYFLKVLQIDPNHEKARQHLAEIQIQIQTNQQPKGSL